MFENHKLEENDYLRHKELRYHEESLHMAEREGF